MNNKGLLSTVSLFSLLSLGVAPKATSSFTTSFSILGPYHEGDADVSFRVSITSKYEETSIRERLSVGFFDSDFTYFYTTAAHNYELKKTQRLTFTLPIKTYLKKKGMDARFQILNSSSEVLKEVSFKLKPVQPKKIQVLDYFTREYESDLIVIDPNSYVTSHDERYKFNGFIDYFNLNNYYRLSLDDIYATYSCLVSFPISTGNLTFIDYDHLFPYLDDESETPIVNIPVKAYKSSSKILFSFANTMYVDPHTLDMSFTARPGFQLTKYFYLPINKREQFLDRVFTLDMPKFGHNENSFTWNIRYTNNRNLIGDCDNSDYCVIGEVV